MDQDGVEVPKHSKKNDANMLQSWPNKVGQKWIYYVKKALFSFGTLQVIPSGKDKAILPARVANHSSEFGSSSPLTQLAVQ